MKKVQALAWSPNGKKIAVANSDRIIWLLDDQGKKKDKVPTKA